ncbi:MAG: pyruvate dehydrogenase complex dihydrolipoamide acetyltransferase [SAR324 cluster bacterium]|nr:pyruvate dehydrogenase complex dihydrolipoamide acetyltransferase [SAR324 cluster bacterium]
MANLLTMPSLSPTMETGVISAWRKQEGEFIEVGEVLAEIETDKAVMDYEMADEGYVRALLVDEGQEVAVGMPIAILSESEDEDISQLLAQAATATPPPAETAPAAPPPAEAAPAAPPEPPAPAPEASAAGLATAAQAPAPPVPVAAPSAAPRAEPVPTGANGGRVKISPYGKKLAEQNQIDWRALVGSGPGGRIVAADVESAISGAAAVSAPGAAPAPVPPPAPGVAFEDVPLSQMRKAIARKMEESKRTVPHFQATRKVRVERLTSSREALNSEFPGDVRISINDMIVKACAVALRQHPTVNSQFLGDRVRRFYTVDIAVAVGTDDGLITPILRGVEHKGLREIAAEIRALAGRAREKKLRPEEYTGGSFTISNLGMYGITEFNGIINTPQACLLAVSGILREPVVEDGALAVGQTMNITLSSDHRVVDGVTAAQFLDTLTRILEHPVAMLL